MNRERETRHWYHNVWAVNYNVKFGCTGVSGYFINNNSMLIFYWLCGVLRLATLENSFRCVAGLGDGNRFMGRNIHYQMSVTLLNGKGSTIVFLLIWGK